MFVETHETVPNAPSKKLGEANQLSELVSSAIVKSLPDGVDLEQFIGRVVESFLQNPKDKYDDDFFFDIIRPIISRLINLRADYFKEVGFLDSVVAENNCESEGTRYAKEVLFTLLEDVDDILLDYDVKPFSSLKQLEDGEVRVPFDALRQKVAHKEDTMDESLVKTIISSLSCGYERKGTILSKERVSAYAAKIKQEEKKSNESIRN